MVRISRGPGADGGKQNAWRQGLRPCPRAFSKVGPVTAMAEMVPAAKLRLQGEEPGEEVEQDCSSVKVFPSTCASPSEVIKTLPRSTMVSLPMSMFDSGL